MKKRIGILMVVVMMMLGIVACGATQELSEEFDEATVKAAAEELVGYINEDDVEAFCGVPMSDSMKEAMTVESTTEIFEQYLGKRGAFVEYKSNVVVGSKDKEIGDCAIAVVTAEYENLTVTYTISYDTEMNLIGFYLK